MPIDYINRPLIDRPYSKNRLSFLDPEVSNLMANVSAIDLIENGDRSALEHWQRNQLTNLFRHAHSRSDFWRARMPSRLINADIFERFPILKRDQLVSQVKAEGCLIQNEGKDKVQINRTTGSTGKPLEVYSSVENSIYNAYRSIAQYFINGLSLDENRTQIWPPRRSSEIVAKKQTVQVTGGWIGPLSKVYRNGLNKSVTYVHDTEAAGFHQLVCLVALST